MRTMRVNTVITHVLLGLAVLMSTQIQGQVDSTLIIKDSILVTKSSKITTRNNPPIHRVVTHTPKSTAPLTPRFLNSTYDVELKEPNPVIKPIKYKERKEKLSNDGLIKIGYGIPRALDAKLMYDYHIEDWYNVGISTGYSAANNVDVEHMLYNAWHTNLYGGYWVKPNWKVFTDVGLARHNQGIYPSLLAPITIQTERNIQNFDASLGSTLSLFESKGLHFGIVGRYSSTALIDESHKQRNIAVGTNLSKTIVPKLILDIDFNYGYAASVDSDASQSTYWIGSPRIKYISEQWLGFVGVDITDSNAELQFWPRVAGEYYLSDTDISVGLHSSMTSDLITLVHVSELNPFIQSSAFSPFAKVVKDVNLNSTYAGSKHTAKLTLGMQLVDHDAIYTYTASSLFNLSSSEQYQQFYAQLEGRGMLLDWLDYHATLEYHSYDDIGDAVGYLPKLDMKIGLIQTLLKDKLDFSQTLQYLTRNARNNQAAQDPILELSAKLEYKLLSQFSLYVEGNNLLMQDYEIWDNYAVYSPKVVFGFKYLIN